MRRHRRSHRPFPRHGGAVVTRASSGFLMLLATGTAAGAAAQGGADNTAVAVLRRASSAYQTLSSFQADFTQHYEDRALELADSKGVLYQEGKNLFAMRFTTPANEFLVADGARFCMYVPSSIPGKMSVFAVRPHPTYDTNLLGAFLDNAVDRYRVAYIKQETLDGHITDAITMEPVDKHDIPFQRARVWFDRESSLPRKMEIEEQPHHVRDLHFTSVRSNLSIPPKTFTCNPPSGTRTVTQQQ